MKLMRKHPDWYDFNSGTISRVVGQAKHCTGCLVANRRLGARAAYNHCLAEVATSPGECYFADVAGPIRPVGIGGAKYILVAVDAHTRFLYVMPMRRKAQAASLLAKLLEHVRVQLIRKQITVCKDCILIRVASLCHETWSPFVVGAGSCIHFQTRLHISKMVLRDVGLVS